MSVAAVGSSVFITAFELVGAYGFRADKKEVKETLLTLLKEERFKIIIIPEHFTDVTSDIRKSVKEKNMATPLFIVVPGLKGEGKGARVQEIKTLISNAVGIQLP